MRYGVQIIVSLAAHDNLRTLSHTVNKLVDVLHLLRTFVALLEYSRSDSGLIIESWKDIKTRCGHSL
jgi:hypothetical protein